jgi:cytochrome c oxidase subunit III
MKPRIVHDVSRLPHYSFGHLSSPWWGQMGLIAIEGMAFALAIAVYLYLWFVGTTWPIGSIPDHWVGTLLTVVLLVSLWPNAATDQLAKEEELGRLRLWLVIMSLVGLIAIAIRWFEFAQLNVMWNENAYGSTIWLILGLHTVHLVTDVGDTLVLTVLMFTRHARGKRFSDVSDNAFYWYFVVGSWLPLYGLLYWFPRWG